jgi:septum formation protein
VPLILASGSPRRAELLAAAGFDFTIASPDVDETPSPGEPPLEYAMRVARAKADHVLRQTRAGAATILAADTVVVGGSRLMGKPVDGDDAVSMLRTLAGTVHDVHTAIVLRDPRGQKDEVVTTRVRFAELTEAEIAWYIRTGEPFGKAGAYGIQGRAARFVEWIDGSWSNVVGLPISTVYRLLKEVGVPTGSGD